MAKQSFVALTNIKYGAPDGTMYHLDPGDSVPDVMSDDELLQLRASGAVAPKAVHDAMVAAEKAQAAADEAKAQAEAELQASNLKVLDAQAQAEEKLAASQSGATPIPTASAPVSEPKATGAVVRPSTTPSGSQTKKP
jgi:hypothetical protein